MAELNSNFNVIQEIVNSTKIEDTCKFLEEVILREEDSTVTGYKLKYLSKLLEEINSTSPIRDKILNDTRKLFNNKNEVSLFGNKVKLAAIYTTYNFKECGHLEYDELLKIEEYIKNRKKEIEEELVLFYNEVNNSKMFKEGNLSIINNTKTIFRARYYNFEVINSNEGETMDIVPPEKIQKEGLKYYIK